jgi:hypothetical protein
MKAIAAASGALLLLAAMPASAFQDTGGAASASISTPHRDIVVKGDKDRKVCRYTPPPTGSRMGGGRICRTAIEWKWSEEQSQRIVEAGQMRQRAEDAYYRNQANGLAKSGPK